MQEVISDKVLKVVDGADPQQIYLVARRAIVAQVERQNHCGRASQFGSPMDFSRRQQACPRRVDH